MAKSRAAATVCFLLDCAQAAFVALSVAILVTGGFVIDVGWLRIRGRTLTNPSSSPPLYWSAGTAFEHSCRFSACARCGWTTSDAMGFRGPDD